jgi:hypothetical protein
LKNLLKEFHSRVSQAGKKISELEDRPLEIVESREKTNNNKHKE